jgi:YVTN family beta-propeller protein
VTVVDAASMSVVARIAVGESPWGVAVGPRR